VREVGRGRKSTPPTLEANVVPKSGGFRLMGLISRKKPASAKEPRSAAHRGRRAAWGDSPHLGAGWWSESHRVVERFAPPPGGSERHVHQLVAWVRKHVSELLPPHLARRTGAGRVAVACRD
jgi:hypothetical protein